MVLLLRQNVILMPTHGAHYAIHLIVADGAVVVAADTKIKLFNVN
jgi:hypothetical protein